MQLKNLMLELAMMFKLTSHFAHRHLQQTILSQPSEVCAQTSIFSCSNDQSYHISPISTSSPIFSIEFVSLCCLVSSFLTKIIWHGRGWGCCSRAMYAGSMSVCRSCRWSRQWPHNMLSKAFLFLCFSNLVYDTFMTWTMLSMRIRFPWRLKTRFSPGCKYLLPGDICNAARRIGMGKRSAEEGKS